MTPLLVNVSKTWTTDRNNGSWLRSGLVKSPCPPCVHINQGNDSYSKFENGRVGSGRPKGTTTTYIIVASFTR